MKHVWTCLLWLTTATAYGQIGQGDWLIGGQGGLRMTSSGRGSRLNLSGEITSSVLYFFWPRIALGGGISADFTTNRRAPYGLSASPAVRIYLHGEASTWYPFVEGNGGVGVNWARLSSGPELTPVLNASLGAAIGTSRFLRPGILLELALSGRQRFQGDVFNSQFPVPSLELSSLVLHARVGLQFLLDRSE
jgi:hypothetical protein